MTVLALRAQGTGADLGTQRLGHGKRAVRLLVLRDDGWQQAAGGQAGGLPRALPRSGDVWTRRIWKKFFRYT